MAVDANSYGSAAGVGVYVPMHTNSSTTFDASTSPTLTIVENWIDQLSAAINLELASHSYSVPATGNRATWLTGWVNQEVAEQIKVVYKRTRRGPNAEGQEQNETRTLTTNIGEIRRTLAAQVEGYSRRAGTVAVTRKDAYSDEYSTTDVDT